MYLEYTCRTCRTCNMPQKTNNNDIIPASPTEDVIAECNTCRTQKAIETIGGRKTYLRKGYGWNGICNCRFLRLQILFQVYILNQIVFHEFCKSIFLTDLFLIFSTIFKYKLTFLYMFKKMFFHFVYKILREVYFLKIFLFYIQIPFKYSKGREFFIFFKEKTIFKAFLNNF